MRTRRNSGSLHGACFGFLILVPAAVLTLFSGCSDSGSTTAVGPGSAIDISTIRQIPPGLLANLAPVVAGNTAFATDLYARLDGQAGNLFFCPYSISTAMAMTWAGARGTTESQMAQVLHFPLGQDPLHAEFGALQRSLERGADSGIGGYRLEVANRLWGEQSYAWQDSFLTLTRDTYEAELQPMPFTQNADSCRLAINQWVSAKTSGNIPDLLPAGSVTSLARLVLTNAVYFKGRWAAAFDPRNTILSDFHTASGATVRAPMMRQISGFGEARIGDTQVLSMPYVGGDLSMIFLLPPDAAGLSRLESSLTPAGLTAWTGALHQTLTDVTIPRFSFRSGFSLKSTLQGMGMTAAFDPDAADFSGMDGRLDLFIMDGFHQAFVKVDEEGTEAAGATGVVIGPMVAPVGASFKADHPFLFLIRDNLTGSVLFLGRVVDPTQ